MKSLEMKSLALFNEKSWIIFLKNLDYARIIWGRKESSASILPLKKF